LYVFCKVGSNSRDGCTNKSIILWGLVYRWNTNERKKEKVESRKHENGGPPEDLILDDPTTLRRHPREDLVTGQQVVLMFVF
jgi:hypothetical protein